MALEMKSTFRLDFQLYVMNVSNALQRRYTRYILQLRVTVTSYISENLRSNVTSYFYRATVMKDYSSLSLHPVSMLSSPLAGMLT